MNDTTASAPGSSLLPDGIATLTTIHFVLLAIVALAAIAMIVVGIRRKRTRVQAERQVEQRAEDAGLIVPPPEPQDVPAAAMPAPSTPTPTPAPAPTPAAPAPVVPAPPPVEDEAPRSPAPLADEPIAAAAPMDATPASVAADVPATPAAVAPIAAAPAGISPADGPVTLLKGLGPKLADRLASLGITTVGQLAALNDDEAAALDAQLGPFAGRMARDRWLEQSRFLAAGDQAGFEAVFGRL